MTTQMERTSKAPLAGGIAKILEEFKAADDEFDVSICPPAASYTDDEFYAFEQSAIFAREWVCVARQEDLPRAGDFITVDVAGEPVIVVRKRDGSFNAMSAVCRHRGACITAPPGRALDQADIPLGDTQGNVTEFKCPYHWWVYDLDGQLVGAPEMARTQDFRARDVKLPSFQIEVWQGFLFVNLDSTAPSLTSQLTEINEICDNYHISELVNAAPDVVPGVAFNWKILVENFLDVYHASRLHDGLHDFAPSSSVEQIEFNPDSAAVWGWSNNTLVDAGFNETFHVLMPPIEGMPEEYRNKCFFASVMPNLMIIGQSDMVIAFQATPRSAGTHDLKLYYCVPESTRNMPEFEELLTRSKKGFEPIAEQDIGTSISVQKGLDSRFYVPGRRSHQEDMVNTFTRMLARRLYAAQNDS